MLDILRKIIQEFSDSSDPLSSMRMMVKEVRGGINSDACAVYFFDSINNKYLLLASEGFKKGVDCNLTINRGEGLVGWLGERAEPVNLDNAPNDPHYKYFPETGEEIYHAFLGVPIIHRKELLGVIVVQQKDKRKFDESEETFVITVATQIGGVIASARLIGMVNNLNAIIKSNENNIVNGVSGSYGITLGTAVLTYMSADIESIPRRKIKDVNKEINLFKKALTQTKNEIKKLADNLVEQLPSEEYLLFDAYNSILDDRTLSDDIINEIKTGQWAQWAVKKVIKKHISYFDQISDAYIRERATDIKYLGQKILANLQKKNNDTIKYRHSTILVGREITAAVLAEIPHERLVGLISTDGTPNSHVAIVARALNIPTVMGAKDLDLDIIDGKEIILDGYNGRIYIQPEGTLRSELIKTIEEDKQLYSGLECLKNAKAETLDGHSISLLVNTGMVSDFFTLTSNSAGADGVGLYRTEVPFLLRDRFPSEQEQRLLYRSTLESFHPLPVNMRTLDIGGDKNLPYFSFKENNPFLGWRGIRVTLDHPEIFLVQLRAMLSASYGLNNLSIMLPMVSSLNEVLDAKKLINQAYNEIVDEGLEIIMPKIGVMVEVPSVIYQLDKFMPHVNFISVGTNDLVQYLLAVDRNNSRVSDLYDYFNPAVLMALWQIARTANQAAMPCGVCGEMAADPMAAILLLAMGYSSLSMNATSLVKIKWVIRNFHLIQTQDILNDVTQVSDPKQIRTYLRTALENAGLGGLIRAGKQIV